MSKFVIYLSLSPYIAEWVTARLGSPVVFPPSSPQNAVIRAFISKRPEGVEPDVHPDGRVAVAIPDSVAKPPEYYNYMSEAGKKAVAESIKDLFMRALWNDMTPLAVANVGFNKLLTAWCEANGINTDRVETVRQCYYRIRDKYAESGINLKSPTRKR